MYIVITKDGFMTTKKLEDILPTDEVTCYCKDDKSCSNIIHGKEYMNEDKNYEIPSTDDISFNIK